MIKSFEHPYTCPAMIVPRENDGVVVSKKVLHLQVGGGPSKLKPFSVADNSPVRIRVVAAVEDHIPVLLHYPSTGRGERQD
jgi:hypothetical protein